MCVCDGLTGIGKGWLRRVIRKWLVVWSNQPTNHTSYHNLWSNCSINMVCGPFTISLLCHVGCATYEWRIMMLLNRYITFHIRNSIFLPPNYVIKGPIQAWKLAEIRSHLFVRTAVNVKRKSNKLRLKSRSMNHSIVCGQTDDNNSTLCYCRCGGGGGGGVMCAQPNCAMCTMHSVAVVAVCLFVQSIKLHVEKWTFSASCICKTATQSLTHLSRDK